MIKICAWLASWRKYVIEYYHSSDRCRKASKATGKRFSLIILIKEPRTPWEVGHKDWATDLPPCGKEICNAVLVIVEVCRKTLTFLPCHKHDTAMDTALSIWNRTQELEERIIQPMNGMIRRFHAYGLELKDSDGFHHDCCKLLPGMELAYKNSIHSSEEKRMEPQTSS
ncbi:hypothetical protein O181_041291 [Austropuccinia psidii MF-1]|uniref:Uncharacterized protein n=1 Tax=Austropuccinia psidii MF-1 TaxID=1389203 RepID=A0A9Q3DJF4_9BASI|nr:hypothetical protein [Austropuccinia psidii MF-1]